jgi:hypothetical protein
MADAESGWTVWACASDAAPGTAADVPGETAPGWSGVAHSPQNFWAAATLAPQAGQTRGRGAPHSPQNF